MHTTLSQPSWCSKTMKRRPCWSCDSWSLFLRWPMGVTAKPIRSRRKFYVVPSHVVCRLRQRWRNPGLCPGVPAHKRITIVLSLFRSHWLAVVCCVVFCIGFCESVNEDRTESGNLEGGDLIGLPEKDFGIYFHEELLHDDAWYSLLPLSCGVCHTVFKARFS